MRYLFMIVIAALLMVSPASTEARTLFYFVHGGCAGGGTASSMGVMDDATGESYLIVRGCDGAICTYPLHGPFQPKIAPGAWTTPFAPSAWHEMTETARLNTTAGAYTGLWLLTDAGDTLRFRNPANEMEHVRYIAMWEREQGGAASRTLSGVETRSPHELNDLVARDLIATYQQQKQTSDGQMAQYLIDRYRNARFGGGMPATAAERQELTDMAARLALTHQTILLRESPSPGNGQRLVIAPIAPAFNGTVRICTAAGVEVWKGELNGTTTISGEGWPVGTYFVQGEGKPLVVSITK